MPRLLPGRLGKGTDINAVIELTGRMGMLHLPLRSIITDQPPEVGDAGEIYLIYAHIRPADSETE